MSEAVYDYTRLKTDLQSWLENVEPDFVGNIDKIIGLGEIRVIKDLDLTIFDVVASVSVATTGLATKPAGYLAAVVAGYVASGQFVVIEPRTYDYVRDYGGTGLNPLYRAELNETQWLFAPAPAAPLSIDVQYIKRPTGLALGTPNTWLGTNVGDALFYACLVSSLEFIKNKDAAAAWAEKYMKMVLPATKLEVASLVRREYGR